MSEVKFTPGPWLPMLANAELDGYAVMAGAPDYSTPRVAYVHTGAADASLISAAPDLYAALHSLAELYEGLDSPSFLRARAALAKARGE